MGSGGGQIQYTCVLIKLPLTITKEAHLVPLTSPRGLNSQGDSLELLLTKVI